MTDPTQTIPASEVERIEREADNAYCESTSQNQDEFEMGYIAGAKSEYLRREREREELVDALRNLADLQNGPPLEQHKAEWTDAMNNAYSVLKKYERSEPPIEP